MCQINLVSAMLREPGTWVEMVSRQLKMLDKKLKERAWYETLKPGEKI